MNKKLKKMLGFDRPKISAFVLMIVVATHFAFPRYVVATESMVPTIPKGSYVVTIHEDLLRSEPKKGDIVVFAPVKGVSPYPWMHRVIGLENEVFNPFTRKGRVDIDDAYTVTQKTDIETIPEGYIYQSGDSDRSYYGLVIKELIRGKVLFHFELPWK
ncbi:hypothetical protein BVY04_02910 [bacterium M21]|nr:hypothetical protein BVY04_02910 [bacterium M21]